ncbi:MAG: YigZ family protein [Eubacterium sp.]|nr:YigZ family protein [Eubacterium sp.]
MEEFFIVEKAGQGEVIEKKSRFIAHVLPVQSEEEALTHIERIKKEYWDARHNCYAFIIGRNSEIQRFSDDGEPQGTAGKPILEVLVNGNIRNTLIVVTRYFGGTLLGTGGLVRAYGLSAKEGIQNALVMRVCEGVSFDLRCDYNSSGKIKYIMGQMNISAEEEYGQDVILHINMKKSDFKKFQSQVVDATSGKAVWGEKEITQYKENIEK